MLMERSEPSVGGSEISTGEGENQDICSWKIEPMVVILVIECSRYTSTG